MPLDKSGSKQSVGRNITAELQAGRKLSVARAIALRLLDEAKKRKRKGNR